MRSCNPASALFAAIFAVIFVNVVYLLIFEYIFAMHNSLLYVLYGVMIPTLGSFPIIQHMIGQRLRLEAER